MYVLLSVLSCATAASDPLSNVEFLAINQNFMRPLTLYSSTSPMNTSRQKLPRT